MRIAARVLRFDYLFVGSGWIVAYSEVVESFALYSPILFWCSCCLNPGSVTTP